MIAEDEVSISQFAPLPEGADQYPIEFIEAHGAIRLCNTECLITVGITEQTDPATITNIRNFHTEPVKFVYINKIELSAYLGNRLGETEKESLSTDVQTTDNRLFLDKLANDAPIVNLVNSICIEGIRSGASDIHIEAGTDSARVRYRLDGVLKTVRTISSSRFPAIASRIKIMANLNILERRQPQDGRITVAVGNEKVDLRVSVVPVIGGESIVLRILGKSAAPRSLEQLGFAKKPLETLRKLIRIPHGLVLVTGPTGSGKTTTLNAILRELVSDTKKIITIEDPVEYLISGVNQIQINDQIDLGFDVILRRVLRQDPNIIMVGEIRDTPTAEIAVRAALTGHLVLSTLHTNDAISVIPRLINMGVEPYLLAAVLRGAVAQRLVRTLCPKCKQQQSANTEMERILQAYGIQNSAIFTAHGCKECNSTGYKGRTVISEIFASDSGLEELILQRQRSEILYHYLKKAGMIAMDRDGVNKIAAGITTLDEVRREVPLEGESN